MTIDEISDSLPNGFHDADICSISLDYVKKESVFLIDVDLSLPDVEVETPSRQGELKLTGLLYCVIEPPAVTFSNEYISEKTKLWVVSDSSDFSVLKDCPNLPEPLPDGSFRHWFFISTHNCFIYVAAMDAMFQWKTSDAGSGNI